MNKVQSLLNKEAVILNLTATTKRAALQEIAHHLKTKHFISNAESFVDALENRENEFSTALGGGIAIPHAQSPVVLKDVVLVARSKAGIDWQAADNQLVHIFFCIALNSQNASVQIDVLQALAVTMQDTKLMTQIRVARSVTSIIKALSTYSGVETKSTADTSARKVVAITACPTGIAHTYLAAEAITKAANELNLQVKVETQGRTTENVLTASDIAAADAIIFAIDKKIDNISRFAGKQVYQTSTKEAIKDAKSLIAKALAGEGKRVNADNGEHKSVLPSELS